MTTEQVAIEVKDTVDASISKKLQAIAKDALAGQSAIDKLQKALNGLGGAGALAKIQAQAAKLATETINQANATARLAAAQNNAQLAAAKLVTENQRLATEQNKTAEAANKASVSLAKVTQAQANTAAAAQKLTQEEEKAKQQILRTAEASARAESAALRLAAAKEKVATKSKDAATSLLGYVRAAAAAVGIGLSAVAVLKLAESYTVLQNKLVNVTENQGQVNTLTDKLFEVANKTRSSVESTTQAFVRFDMALVGMGKSQEDTLQLTETINKALVVGGGTAQEASSALLQLSQAFNAGKLQGDEFRSVAENMPIAIDAIAKVTGKTRGELKEFASEGKITAKVLFDAFTAIRTELDTKFAKTVPTISQAFVVLKNNATQFFGQLDKQLGITSGIAKAILFLSQNMGAVTVAVGALAAVIATALTPALVAATKAATALLLPLLANPFVLAAAAVGALVTAILVFGNKITVFDECRKYAVSLLDVLKAVGGYVAGGFRTAFDGISELAKPAIDFISKGFDGIGDKISNAFGSALDFIKNWNNKLIGIIFATVKTIGDYWGNIGPILESAFGTILNKVVDLTQSTVNTVLKGINFLADKVNAGAEKIGIGKIFENDLSVSLDSMKVKVGSAAMDFANTASANFQAAMDTDFIGGVVGKVQEGARKIAEERQKLEQAALRKGGKDTTKPEVDKKAAAEAERRSLALEKINAQLDKEAARMFVLAPLREAQERFDQIEIALAAKKIKLNADEAASIREKIDANQKNLLIQAEFDRIYSEVTGPINTYLNSLTAIDRLLSKGAITQEDAAQATKRAITAYTDARSPLTALNKALSDEIELLKVEPLKRAAATKALELRNRVARGEISLTEEQIVQYEKQAQALEDVKRVYSDLDSYYESNIIVQKNLEAGLVALNIAFERGLVNSEGYAIGLAKIQVAMARLRLMNGQGSAEDSIISILGKFTDNATNFFDGATNAAGDFFKTVADGAADAFGKAFTGAENFAKSIKSSVKSALQNLIAQLIKLSTQSFVISLIATGSTGGAGVGAQAVGQAGSSLGSSLLSGAGLVSKVAGIGSSLGFGALTGAEMAFSSPLASLAMGGANIAGIGGAGVAAGIGQILGTAVPLIGAAALVANAFGLFKSKKVTDTGIAGTLSSGGTALQQFTETRKGGSLFSGPSYSTSYSDVSAAESRGVSSSVDTVYKQSIALGKALGLSTDAAANYTKEIQFSTKGLSDAQIQEKLTGLFNDLQNELANRLSGGIAENFGKEGETASQTLIRLASSLQNVNTVLESLGQTAFESSMGFAVAASNLIDAFGGIENYANAASSYLQNYYTEAERTNLTIQQFTKVFDSLNIAVPTGKEAFRALVESQDLTTESGRNTYAALLKVAEAFASVNEITEQATETITKRFTAEQIAQQARAQELRIIELTGTAAEYLAAQRQDELASLDSSRIATQMNIYAIEDKIAAEQKAKQATEELNQSLLKAADSAFNLLKRSVENQKEINRKVYETAAASAKRTIDQLTKSISNLDDLSKKLSSTLDSMVIPGAESVQRQAAKDTISKATSQAQAGNFGAIDSAAVGNALSILSKSDANLYATQADYVTEYASNYEAIQTLYDLTKTQKSIEQLSLDAANSQLEVLEKAYNDEVFRLDGILTAAQDQIDAINGVDKSLMSILDAIANFNKASEAAGGGKISGTAAITNANGYVTSGAQIDEFMKNSANTVAIQNEYQKSLGRAADLQGLIYFEQLAMSGTPIQQILDAIKTSPEAIKYMDGSHANGLGYVPFDGYMAELHRGERVMTAEENSAYSTGGDSGNAALVAELRNLNSNFIMFKEKTEAQLRDIGDKTGSTKDVLNSVFTEKGIAVNNAGLV